MRLVQALRRWKAPVAADPAYLSALGGGFYVGRISENGLNYYLITASKSSEITMELATTSPGNLSASASAYDGLANSIAMVSQSSTHTAAVYCLGYVDALGNDDYYLPALYELELAYRNGKPSSTPNTTGYGTNPNSIPAGTAYTESSPAKTPVALFQDPSGAQRFNSEDYWSSTFAVSISWYAQNFINGEQVAARYTNTRIVRPMRKILVT